MRLGEFAIRENYEVFFDTKTVLSLYLKCFAEKYTAASSINCPLNILLTFS